MVLAAPDSLLILISLQAALEAARLSIFIPTALPKMRTEISTMGWFTWAGREA
jgi:hypothetical protein